MVDYVSDDWETKFLGKKRPLDIRQGYNTWDWGYNPVLPKYSKSSDKLRYIPSETTFPEQWESSIGLNYYYLDPLPTWDGTEDNPVPEPEPDINEYVNINRTYFHPDTAIWISGTISAGSELGRYDLTVPGAIFENAIDLRGLPDATVLVGCYFSKTGLTPTFNTPNHELFVKETGLIADPTLIEKRPYFNMGGFEIPRFKYFPHIWNNIMGTYYKTAHYFPVSELALPSVPYTFHPSLSSTDWQDWLGEDNILEIYKDNYRDKYGYYFYRTDIDTPPEADSIEEKLSLLPIHKAQCPQDAISGHPGTINTARHDMVFLFGDYANSKVLIKWVCNEGYIKDGAGDDYIEDVLTLDAYVSLDATPLEEWMNEYNALVAAEWEALEPIKWYHEEQSTFTTDTDVGYPFVLRYYYSACKIKVGISPYQLGSGFSLYTDLDDRVQASIKEVHREGRPIKGEGFFWESEAPSWYAVNYPL